MEATDTELMHRLASGDDTVLNALMLRWRERIAAFLLKVTGHAETALDLTQETFVKLYQARERYRPAAKFSTYLFAIAANLGRNHARWKARHPTISLDEDVTGERLMQEAVDSAQAPDESAAAGERLRTVQEAFNALPEDLREAMTLFINEEMSYQEIASVVQCSPKAAEMRIYRARQILKTKLKEVLA